MTSSEDTHETSDSTGDMAVVGVSIRFPGDVNDLESMWNMLSEKSDKSGTVSFHRWDTDAAIASRGAEIADFPFGTQIQHFRLNRHPV